MTGSTTLRVAVAQLPVRVGDLDGNTDRILAAYRWAAEVGADVLVTPEMALTGYPVEDLLAEPAFVADTQAALARVAEGTASGASRALDAPGSEPSASRGPVVLVGAPLPPAAGSHPAWVLDTAPGRLVNAAAVVQDGRVVTAIAKRLLPTYGVFDDSRWFAPGARRQPLLALPTPHGVVRAAVLICEDVWDAELAAQACEGADVALVLNASPYVMGKPLVREAVVGAAARAAGVPVVYAACVGGQDELVFDGGSFVVSAAGEPIARAAFFATDRFVLDLPLGREATEPDAVPTPLALGEPDAVPTGDVPTGDVPGGEPVAVPVVTLAPTGAAGRRPLPAPPLTGLLDPHEEVYAALVVGMRDYCTRVGLPRVLLGLSGGIDSALAAVIAVDALGADAVRGVGMPGPYSSAGSVDDARALADALGIAFDVVGIREPYEERYEALSGLAAAVAAAAGRAPAPVAWENLQARLRGLTLMTLANAGGYLVCSTGNRSESAVGYFTLYGDSCGTAPNPLGDLLKTDVVGADGRVLPGVFGLARWRNAAAVAAGQVPPIPEATLTKPPSAELAEGQADTDSLPPYPVLDRLLLAFLEDHASADELVSLLVTDGYADADARAIVVRVLSLVEGSEFKRRQVPMRVKVSRLAFGRDRRMPVASAYRRRPR